MQRFLPWLKLLLLMCAGGLCGFAALPLRAADADVNAITSAGPTDDALTALRRFRIAPGFKADVFASDPMIRNVVSFAFDEQGRCYVVESFRRRTSVFDIRGLGEWLDNDFSLRTVDDRANFFKSTITSANPNWDRFLRSKRGLLSDFNHDGKVDWHDLEVESERIRLLVDTNHDGRADVAVTLAEGFDGITSGVAAGILARKGEVWFTCIPDLWKITNLELLRTSGLPPADSFPVNPHLVNRKSQIVNLQHGFGVHIAFGGHDMHGLKMGPDGKMYFSIADRGTGTNLWDKIIDHWPGLTMEALADSGAVFRCEPDGSQLEVVAIGLRNPQELGFDEFGNLFTGDNNADGGDKARWEYIVEGADYGWRMGWQWLPRLGAWNSEMLWGLEAVNTSRYHLPPVAHIGSGPSGVAYYPGTGLPARYDRHFFMCDFRGGPNSVVRAFALRPKGATFEAYDESEFLTGPLCVDVDFGLDGAVYVSDWVKGWDKTDKARIYRVFDPALADDAAMAEVRKLLGEGMEKRSNEELARLLGHHDMRVRLEAQWELGERAASFVSHAERMHVWTQLPSSNVLSIILQSAGNPALDPRARCQALSAFGKAMQAGPYYLNGVLEGKAPSHMGVVQRKQVDYFSDPNPAIRETAWQIWGDGHPSSPRQLAAVEECMRRMTAETNLHVRLIAANAVGHMATLHSSISTTRFANGPIQTNVSFYSELDEPGCRNRAVSAMFSILRDGEKSDAYVRHGAVFALARIGDVPALVAAAKSESPAVRLGACLALRRLQRTEVAQFLHDSDPQIVLEAARAINDGPIPAAMPDLAKLLATDGTTPLQPAASGKDLAAFTLRRALNARFRLGTDEDAKALANFAASTAPESLRAEALELLALWPKPPGRDHVVGLWRPLPARDPAGASKALASVLTPIEATAPSMVKVAARKAATGLGLNQGGTTLSSSEQLAKYSSALENGTLAEKQSALAGLAALDNSGAAALVSMWAEQLGTGNVPRELQLDVLGAAEKNSGRLTPAAVAGLKKFESVRDTKDALAKWRECLYGGNAEDGKKTFIERQDAACFRCHKIKGEGGDVGPELAGLGQRQPREYILESILFPNKTISPGFESVLITLQNGKSYAGILKSESPSELVVQTLEDGIPELVKVRVADVKTRDRGLSAMPEELGNILSKTDLRNLVEFLSTLK